MKHDDFRDLISMDADGRLPGSRRAELAAHLAACADCAAFDRSMRAASTLLRSVRPPARSEAFVQRVLDRLPAETPRPLPLRWLVPALCGALAAAIVVWTPTLSQEFSGPVSLVAASIETPSVEFWGIER